MKFEMLIILRSTSPNLVQDKTLEDMSIKRIYWRQFHQHFTRAFFVRKLVFGAKISHKSTSLSKISCKKRARKMLLKLTDGWRAFYLFIAEFFAT